MNKLNHYEQAERGHYSSMALWDSESKKTANNCLNPCQREFLSVTGL